MSDEPVMPVNPSLADLQRYVAETSLQRGFDDETVQDRFMLLVEEVGELAKALRPLHGVKMADDARDQNIEHELADVLLLLLSISNKLEIDMQQAVTVKEEKNKQRQWQ